MVNEQPSPAASDAAPAEPARAAAQSGSGEPVTVSGAQLPTGYVWAYQPPPEPERPWRAPRWLIALSILWAIGLVVSGTIYALRGKPTVREQTTVASSQPTVDRAIGNVVKAAGAGPAVVLGAFVKSSGCDITPVRSGVEYTRTVDLFATPGTESTMLKTIAAGLPRSYAAKTGPGNVLSLNADAGDFVGLIGAAPGPGELEIKAETGCREAGETPAGIVAPGLGADEMAPIRTVLNALGATAVSTSAAQIPCAGASGVMRTVSARAGAVPNGSSLATVLTPIAPHPVIATANVFAYHAGKIDIVTSKDPTGVTVSATSRCQ